MRVEAGDVAVAFDDVENVQAALERTSSVRVEQDKPVDGTLEGLLPNTRRFELRISDGSELIAGRIARSVVAPDAYKALLDQRRDS